MSNRMILFARCDKVAPGLGATNLLHLLLLFLLLLLLLLPPFQNFGLYKPNFQKSPNFQNYS
jgi:hypothetical protein